MFGINQGFPQSRYSGATPRYGRKAQPSVVLMQKYNVNTVGN